MNYCYNHDVATGAYDCPYADVVNNSICCNCEECNYNGIYNKPSDVVNNSIMCTAESCWYQYNKYADPLNKSMVVNNDNVNYDLTLNDEDIVDYPF